MAAVLAVNKAKIEAGPAFEVGPDAPATFKRVLVGVDGTPTGRDAIALGQTLCDADGCLTLAHVLLVPRPVYGNLRSTAAGKKTREMLAREREVTRVPAELAGVFAPAVGSGLHQLALDTRAYLLVVGSSGRRPISQLLRRDNTRGTVTGAPCAVAVAPRDYAGQRKPIDTIGIAYHRGHESEIALVAARVLGARHGAALRAMTAVWPTSAISPTASRLPGAGALWALMLGSHEEEASERLRALAGVDGRVVIGPPRAELIAFSEQVDLLVVGSSGHGPLHRLLLGSTSAYLLRTARCPLLVLPRARAGGSLGSRP